MTENKTQKCWHIICPMIPPIISSIGEYALNTAKKLNRLNYEVHLWTLSNNKNKNRNHQKHDKLYIHNISSTWENNDFRKIDLLLNRSNLEQKILWYYQPEITSKLYHKLNNWTEQTKKYYKIYFVLHKPLEPYYYSLNFIQLYKYLKEKRLLKKILKNIHQIFITAPYLEKNIESICNKKKLPNIHWLPLRSNVNYIKDPNKARNIRKAFAPEAQFLLGCYGSYYEKNLLKQLKRNILLLLQNHPERTFLCLGRKSEKFVATFKRNYPNLANQIESTGELDQVAISAHIQACDIMIQPYPDGVTAKRTSILASLLHEKAILTTSGNNSELFWSKRKCVLLYKEGSDLDFITQFEQIIYDSSVKKRLELKAKETYQLFFSLNSTIQKLLSL